MNKMEYWWKIMGNGVTVLTYIAPEYNDGDGVYAIMKKLQRVYGPGLCSTQKYDPQRDKIEDFNTILRTVFNLDGNRLIAAELFEYDRKTNKVTINRQQTYAVREKYGYTYSFRTTYVGCDGGWAGLRRFLLSWMDFCSNEFGCLNLTPIIELETLKAA